MEQRLAQLRGYSRSQSTGAETSRSRSFARKKLDSDVITFESTRMPTNVRSATPRILPASSGPTSGTRSSALRIL